MFSEMKNENVCDIKQQTKQVFLRFWDVWGFIHFYFFYLVNNKIFFILKSAWKPLNVQDIKPLGVYIRFQGRAYI